MNSCWWSLMSWRICGLFCPISCNRGCSSCGFCWMRATICMNWGCWRRAPSGDWSAPPPPVGAPPSPPPPMTLRRLKSGAGSPPSPPAPASPAPASSPPASPSAAAISASADAPSGIPVIRYSTARSALPKAALSAASTCERSKPMSHNCVIVSSEGPPSIAGSAPRSAGRGGGAAAAAAGAAAPGCSGLGVSASAGAGFEGGLTFETMSTRKSFSLMDVSATLCSSVRILPA
mmetsp:Transcript_15772/g.42395  ORF Transcript_15772/g.42395 Transcript_15772/m.42395 type:complete len:233 (+) Transcript_15772:808-1506(+)